MKVIPFSADTTDIDFMHRFNHIYLPNFSIMNCDSCKEESTLIISADGKNSSAKICCEEFKVKIFAKMEYLANPLG